MTTEKPIKDQLSGSSRNEYYHDPVLFKEKRFYLIQVDKLQIVQKRFKKPFYLSTESQTKKFKESSQNRNQSNFNEKLQKLQWSCRVSFQIGCRSSSSQIVINDQILNPLSGNQSKHVNPRHSKLKQTQKVDRLNEKSKQMKNALKYELEESDKVNKALLQMSQTIGFQDLHIFPFQKQQVMTVKLQIVEGSNLNIKQYAKQYGYALIPVVPFIKMPYTQHQVQIDLVQQNQKKELKKDIVAKLTINVYFMHHFKGSLFIEVVKADIQRNLAIVGQMTPKMRIFCRQNQFQTEALDEGGIKPQWKSQKEDEYCYFNIPIQSSFDDLYFYLFFSRQMSMDDIIGQLKISLQEEGMFKRGRQLKEFIKDTQKIIREKKGKRLKQIKTQARQKVKSEEGDWHNLKLKSKGRKEEIQNLCKNLVKDIQLLREEELIGRLYDIRIQLIQELFYKNHTLNSKNSPLYLQSYVNQLITKIYGNEEFRRKQSLIREEWQKDIFSTKEDRQYFTGILKEEYDRLNLKKDLTKMIIEQFREVAQILSSKMEQKQIELKCINGNPKNQADEEQTVGKLDIKYFFLYNFDYRIPERQQREIRNFSKQQKNF